MLKICEEKENSPFLEGKIRYGERQRQETERYAEGVIDKGREGNIKRTIRLSSEENLHAWILS